MPKLKCHSISLLATLLLVFATSTVQAQTAAEREAAQQAEILQRQSKERLQSDIDRAAARHRHSEGADAEAFMPPTGGTIAPQACRDIKEISIEGAPNLSPDVATRIPREFAGRCLGVAEIEQILALITRDYILRGYITTRAYLPAQDLSTGILRILVQEGVLEKILLEDGGRNSVRPGNAFPMNEGDLLNLRDIEQGLEQINRLQSNRATMDIQPGSQPGSSMLVVRNEPTRPYHASFSLDNQGSESTGKDQQAITLGSDGLLGLNDLLLLTHRQSYGTDKQKRYAESSSLTFSVPFGYSTFSYSRSQSSYTSGVSVAGGLEISTNGTTATDNLRFDRVMYRDQTSRATLNGGLTLKESKNYLAGQFLAVSSRRLSVFDAGVSWTMGVIGGALTLDMGVSKGLDIAGALKDPEGSPGSAARAQFTTYKYGYAYRLPFKLSNADWSFSSQLTGQRAADVLYGSEQIAIGGIYSVRGFVKNTLAGDHGYYVRNELSLRHMLPLGDSPLSTRWFVALDQGEVRNRAAGVPSGRLLGMAYGVSLQFKGGQFEVFGARPISFPNQFPKESPQGFARLSYAL